MRCRLSWCAVTLLALALALAGCGSDGGTPVGDDTATRSAAPLPGEGISQDSTWYDAEEMAAAQDDVAVTWLAGWFVPEALEGVTIADLEVRYRRVTGLAAGAPAEQVARVAFAALTEPGPVDLINPLEGVALRLLGARVEQRDGVPIAVLDFDAAIAATNQLGHLSADAETQLHAMVREYFPEATHVALTVEGAGAELFGGKPYGAPVPLAQ